MQLGRHNLIQFPLAWPYKASIKSDFRNWVFYYLKPCALEGTAENYLIAYLIPLSFNIKIFASCNICFAALSKSFGFKSVGFKFDGNPTVSCALFSLSETNGFAEQIDSNILRNRRS